MSARKAKEARRIIGSFKYPPLQYTATNQALKQSMPLLHDRLSYRTKTLSNFVFFWPEKTYQVEVDHSRRIRRIAKTLHTNVQAAIELYNNRLGLVVKK